MLLPCGAARLCRHVGRDSRRPALPSHLQAKVFSPFPLALSFLNHHLDSWQQFLYMRIISFFIVIPPDVALSYIRGNLSNVSFYWFGAFTTGWDFLFLHGGVVAGEVV